MKLSGSLLNKIDDFMNGPDDVDDLLTAAMLLGKMEVLEEFCAFLANIDWEELNE